jgi:hypothetical protein
MDHVTPRIGRPSRGAFYRWLECARAGEQLEYHRGLLTRDRSPASDLAAGDRRVLAEVADAAFRVAGEGSVHLVQRRHGPFDFSYIAIKAGRVAIAVARALPLLERLPPLELAAAA